MTLRHGKNVEAAQERQKKLVQRGEAEFGLGFDPHHTDDVEIPGRLHGIVEERRLPYARLTLKHEDGAKTFPSCFKDTIRLPALEFSAQKHAVALRRNPPEGAGISPLLVDRSRLTWEM